MTSNKITLSDSAKDLFKPKRYKVYYGGRGGGKSHDFASALLIMGTQKKLLILCAREVQKSIDQSVHRLLKNKIRGNDTLAQFYQVQNNKIVGANGTEFHFHGLKFDPDAIKSYEGADICWVEEAANVPDRSWEVLIPTIRKEGSEIWVSFNPRYATDPTWVRMVENADENFLVKEVSYRDNPWFPNELKIEMERLKKSDYKAYEHIWEGKFDERFQGCVYASYLKEAMEAERISVAPYKKGVPVVTAWDLGRADSTAIWFAQRVGQQIRIIDFYENNNEDLAHYADIINNKPYGTIINYLPHDSRHERLGMEGSIKDQLKNMGLKCEDVKHISEEAGIQLARSMLSDCWFDKEATKDGIHALNHFQYEYDDSKKVFKNKPSHDWSSHAADAFRYLAIAMQEKQESAPIDMTPLIQFGGGGSNSWMG